MRIILTGFADMDATIGAINDGHVYAYVTKPWEPDQLKQVVRRAVDHHQLACENERLLAELRARERLPQAVMDELDTGALAVDAAGVVRAANRPARDVPRASATTRAGARSRRCSRRPSSPRSARRPTRLARTADAAWRIEVARGGKRAAPAHPGATA